MPKIVLVKKGGGLAKVTKDDGCGEGVWNPPIWDDVICEHFLTDNEQELEESRKSEQAQWRKFASRYKDHGLA